MERITGVAIVRQNGEVFSLPPPNRHNHVIHALVLLGDSKPIKGEQGFVTDTGRFVDRSQAAKIALACGQIDYKAKELYSEDLW